MPIDNTIFRDYFHLRERQHQQRQRPGADRDVSIPALISPTLPPGSFDGPSDTSTRPRHHFRRGAISAASGQRNLAFLGRGQVRVQQEVRVRSRTANEIEITIAPPTDQRQTGSDPIDQRPREQLRELVEQIRRGLVNIATPAVQARINELYTSLPRPVSTTRVRPAMESESVALYRDTHRYGREGWWTVENDQRGFLQRPATIPGSTFAVPQCTLNLFQSVDLFAPPPPPPTILSHARSVGAPVLIYCDHLENCFNEMVATRRRGYHVPKGKLFLISMELSRVRQLMEIVSDEYLELEEAEREASRRNVQREARCHGQIGSSERDFLHEHHPNVLADDDSVCSGLDEPEGWANLDLVFDDDCPEEVCFHIGSREVTFPIEQVEAWIMDEWRRERRDRSGRRMESLEPFPDDARRILHTFAMPETVRPIWVYGETMSHDDNDDDAEAEEAYEDYGSVIGDDEGGISDHENEMEDDSEEAVEDLDHEGWGDAAPQDSQPEGQLDMATSDQIPSLDAGAQVPVIHPPGSSFWVAHDYYVPILSHIDPPSPIDSQVRSQNTSDDSDPATVTSSESEDQPEFVAPDPVHDWAVEHLFFMYSCRGSIFDVARQVQHAFAFAPPLNPHLVGERLNGEFVERHHQFILLCLPGEVGINLRASRRSLLHQQNSADDDIYHGTQNIAEGDVGSEDYVQPPLPDTGPECWDRRLDVCLLMELNRGRFSCRNFWQGHQDLIGNVPLSCQMSGFLAMRLAQVRYLSISEAEQQAVRGIGSRGQDD